MIRIQPISIAVLDGGLIPGQANGDAICIIKLHVGASTIEKMLPFPSYSVSHSRLIVTVRFPFPHITPSVYLTTTPWSAPNGEADQA